MLPLQALLDERVLDAPDHLLDILPVGVYICDREGLIVRYNRAAAELWGIAIARDLAPARPRHGKGSIARRDFTRLEA